MNPRQTADQQAKPSIRRSSRWTVLGVVNAMVMALSLTGFFVVASSPAAVAAPNIAIAVSGPSDALIQATSTPMTYTATVTNPSPNPNGYNLGYKVTLPPGVTLRIV